MIRNRQNVLSQVSSIITTGRVAQANQWAGRYLPTYQRVRTLRQQNPTVSSFLANNTCIQAIRDTLISWGMNNRAAKIKDVVPFRSAIQGNIPAFQAVEAAATTFTWTNRGAVLQSISALYSSLALMQTNGRLVSNAKCLHFVFPELCLPMDTRNTLQKLYRNNYESPTRFLEVLEFCYDVLAGIQNPQQYVQGLGNTCATKLVDNAIILL
jgi:hypothetical protein